MDDVSKWELAPSFSETLERDGFDCIGYYEIKGNCYKIHLNKEAKNRQFTIYSFVSFGDGGKHIRIGKVQGKRKPTRLKDRLTPNNVNKALHLIDMTWVKERMKRAYPVDTQAYNW